MKPPPTIRVDSIPEEGLTLDLALEPAWLAAVLSDAEMRPAEAPAGRASVRLDVDGRDVIVSGSFSLRVVGACVACLEDVELPVAASFQLVLSPAEAAAKRRPHEEVELTSDELDADLYEGGVIDLSHWLREQVLLEAPVHPRHEGDCPKALEPPRAANGGAARDIDPRLAPLLKLR